MKQRLYRVIKAYIVIIVIFISYFFINKYTGFGIPCPFNKLTGLLCPGCGVTRCLFSILQLHFREAFNYNPLVFIYLPFIIAYILYKDYLYVYNKKDKILVKIPSIFTYILLIITIAFGIIRNII